MKIKNKAWISDLPKVLEILADFKILKNEEWLLDSILPLSMGGGYHLQSLALTSEFEMLS